MDHPAIGLIPAFVFLGILLFAAQLVQEPYLRYLPSVAGFCLLISLLLAWLVYKRNSRTSQHFDSQKDIASYYSNSKVPIEHKYLLLQKRTGFFTLIASLEWFLLALMFIGLWASSKYFTRS